MNTLSNTPVADRRMDVELTAEEISQLHLLAIRERARTGDKDQKIVNLARKFTEYRRQVVS